MKGLKRFALVIAVALLSVCAVVLAGCDRGEKKTYSTGIPESYADKVTLIIDDPDTETVDAYFQVDYSEFTAESTAFDLLEKLKEDGKMCFISEDSSYGAFLKAAGDSFDIVFMGSDFGTQLDLLVSPECFRKFILPGIKRLVGVAKKYGKFVMWHSCGSIYKIIPDLIDTGIDILHPLQARAQNMDANTLAKEFKQDLAFCGGVDTQDLLIHATPQQIREEVLRLREIFGENYIVGPSHEELLNNIPLENVIAMARAAKE